MFCVVRIYCQRSQTKATIVNVNDMIKYLFTILTMIACTTGFAQSTHTAWDKANTQRSRFRVLALAEDGGHHIEFTKAAKPWLNQLAADSNFSVTYISNTNNIDSAYLSQYALFLQLDYAPYGWPDKAAKAFEDYIKKGRGGWVGLHHASLIGEFDGFPLWIWWYHFMGGIRWKDYIPGFADGEVITEDPLHPVMKGLPSCFTIEKEEWYTYDKSPRSGVHVLASVNESSYQPQSSVTMGDHPVVWSNEHLKAKNVYIFMGHSPLLFQNSYYTTLLRNAILWAAQRK